MYIRIMRKVSQVTGVIIECKHCHIFQIYALSWRSVWTARNDRYMQVAVVEDGLYIYQNITNSVYNHMIHNEIHSILHSR